MRMPPYEYECLKCGRVFEIRQRISEPPLTVCDTCGGQVRRLLSAAPLILKGGGGGATPPTSLQTPKKGLGNQKGRKKTRKTTPPISPPRSRPRRAPTLLR